MDGRLRTASKPPVGGKPPGTAMRSGMGPPGTAGSRGRLGTAQGGRPGTGSRAPGAPPMTARPLTQQGLSGMQAGSAGGRHVHDAHYFYGKLSEKRSQVLEANEKLRGQLDDFDKNRSKYEQMVHRLEGLDSEVKDLETQLQEYNLVVQKATTQATPDDLQNAIATSLDASKQVEARLRDLHKARMQFEAQQDAAERDIAAAEEQLEARLSSLPPEQQREYAELQAEVKQLKAEAARMDTDAADIQRETQAASAVIAKNPVKQQALQLQRSIASLEAERVHVGEEAAQLADPRLSMDALTAKMQRSRNELETLKTQVKDRQIEIKDRELKLASSRPWLLECRDENREKFQKLLQKEEEVNSYLDRFNAVKSELLQQRAATAAEVKELLSTLKKYEDMHANATPDAAALEEVKNSLQYKEVQAKNSEETTARLEDQLNLRKAELEKIDTLEDKIKAEVASITEHLDTLESDLRKFTALDALKDEMEARRRRLEGQRESLGARVELLSSVAAAKEKRVQAKGEQLMAASWFQEFQKAEDKLRKVTGETFQLSEIIQQRETESNYRPIVDSIKGVVQSLNTEVIKAL